MSNHQTSRLSYSIRSVPSENRGDRHYNAMRKWSFSFTGVRKYKRHCNTIITRAWSEWREVEEKFRASTSGRCCGYSCARHEYTIANTISRVSRPILSRLHSYAILRRAQNEGISDINTALRSKLSLHRFVPFSAPLS